MVGSTSTWSLVLAAGAGKRFGTPKQFQPLGTRRLVDWSVKRAKATTDGVTLVLPPEVVWDGEPVDAVVAGGNSHAESVLNGLSNIPETVDVLLIVTSSHPLASETLFRRVLTAMTDRVSSVAPAVPLADAVKYCPGTQVLASVDKSRLMSIQAPSAFRLSELRNAFQLNKDAPEEHELIESDDCTTLTVPGEETNLHITTPLELAMANAILPLALEHDE